MSWISEHMTQWRVAELALLVAALMGPWFFDVINVPAQYPCSAPNIRLEGDFCGTPLPMAWLLFWMAVGSMDVAWGLVTGTATVGDLGSFWLGLLLAIPFFSTLLLVLRGDRGRKRVFNMVAWGLALGVALVMGLSGYLKFFWVLWGLWLYAALAACALVFEAMALRRGGTAVPG